MKSAEVPADCRLPAQRLVNNTTTKGRPGDGSLVDIVAYGDLAGLGYPQALTAYGCNAGGVSWPQDLLLIGSGGKLLASLNLGTLVPSEHSDLVTARIDGSTAHITWQTYEGAGFDRVHQSATVTYRNGKLVLSNYRARFDPETVVSDVLVASKRSDLQDPRVIDTALWGQLQQQVQAGYTFTISGSAGTCVVSGAIATCPFDGVASGGVTKNGIITLTRTSSTSYGWKVSNLQFTG